MAAAGLVALALGLFSGSGKDDTALGDPKPSVPVAGEAPAGPSPSPTGPAESASASASPSASASASRSATASASPSPSRTSAAPSPSPSASASRATKPAAPPPAPPAKPATLRSGDSGPEVLKLQRLLAEQGMYDGRFDSRYGRSVERAVTDFQIEYGVREDPWGVYGPATRRALEG
ncbi:peptidoglycan-binding protein [Streptomyces sp. NPDC096136]|uniref:peptidoglycan-binding domain-containing protein n=1 Tax=Streptomyces sp. NPDC096136 TaxID=3366076 RepID=UPI0038306970